MSAQILGVIAPHPPIMVESVGGTRSRATDASIAALGEAAKLLRAYDPDTVVLMSPHAPAARDAFVVETAERSRGSFAEFGAPDDIYEFVGDPALARAILREAAADGIPVVDRSLEPSLAPGRLDHGVMVPMHFLDPDGRWPLVELSLSWLPLATHTAFGHAVSRAAEAEGRRIAFVASGDCSHRLSPDAPAGYSPRAEEFDRELVSLIGASDFDSLADLEPALIEAAGECGLRSFITLGGVAAPARARVLSYEAPWGVGYLSAVVNEHAVTPSDGVKGGAPGEDETEIVRLARLTVESFIRSGTVPSNPVLHDPELPQRAGAFVTLHRMGQLRGCIGTITPTRETLASEVVHNAVEAATRDPRFLPLDESELGDLDIKVDVLHPPQPATVAELDPSRYGVIVTSGARRGLLLPDLDGVDSTEQQLDIARRKAGIGPGEAVELERFRVDRYS